MSLHLQHLNADSTFLMVFTAPPDPARTSPPKSFHLVLDPWLHSDAPVLHRKFSNQTHTVPCLFTSLAHLPRAPDGIIVSQDKTDHCHEGTLKELDWAASNTRLYAIPEAASTVKSWPWFPKDRLSIIRRSALRIDIGGTNREDGEVGNAVVETTSCWLELEHLPAKWAWEMPALHIAIGIKFVFYDPLTSEQKLISTVFTPHGIPASALRTWINTLPPSLGPASARNSNSSDGSADSSTQAQSDTAEQEEESSGFQKHRLSLLLHPFNLIMNPPYLGGLISSGYPAGRKICQKVNVGVWCSAHDESKKVEGFVADKIRKQTWEPEDVARDLRKDGVEAGVEAGVFEREKFGDNAVHVQDGDGGAKGVRVLELEVGESLEIFP